MAASALPGAFTALQSLLAGAQATTLDGVTLFTGPPAQAPPGITAAVVLGGTWDPAETLIGTSAFEPFSDYADLERLTIPGAVMTTTGDPNAIAAVTTQAFAILGAVKDLINADSTLGGAVGYAEDAGGGGKAEPSSLARLASLAPRCSAAGGTRCVIDFTVSAAALATD